MRIKVWATVFIRSVHIVTTTTTYLFFFIRKKENTRPDHFEIDPAELIDTGAWKA